MTCADAPMIHFMFGASASRVFRIAALLSSFAAAGCSVELPSMLPDDTTGSIRRMAPPENFTAGDWRVAEPALRQALKSSLIDEASDWSNPLTGAGGKFRAVGEWFDKGGRDCRGIVSEVATSSRQSRVNAVGCIDKSGNAVVSDQKAADGA